MMMNIYEDEQFVVVELDEEELDEVAGGRHVESKGNGVRIRSGAGTDYRIIGKVNKGDRITDGALSPHDVLRISIADPFELADADTSQTLEMLKGLCHD